MPVYVISGTDVTAHAKQPRPKRDGDLVICSEKDLDGTGLSNAQLAAIWNALPNTGKVTRFKSRKMAVRRVWEAIAKLPLMESAGKSGPTNTASKGKPAARRESKQTQVIAMLRRPRGASLDEIVKATGWQRHTVRGAISGAIKKKLGRKVLSEKCDDGARAYRIA
jgi:hypothetical protein